MKPSLPIDPFIDRIRAEVRRSRAAVITAEPGAGKTTRVPPALIDDGPLILLQPRRVAARAIARRIADERGWTIGREIGWQIRFERRFSAATRLLVATEGVLTARLQGDPLLSDFHTIVLDEFHERSVHADLALAMAKQAWRARHDLRIVVMSATLDAAAVSAFLDNCPVIDVPGRVHPMAIEYRPGERIGVAAVEALARSPGDVLCFLPGAAEIRRAIVEIEARTDREAVEVIPLHGSLAAHEQELALRSSSARRRIVVATNIAETSLTVPKVTAVVDTGLHKVARYHAERGIDSLEVERITADAAEQRAGRAGRLSPGVVWRLWDARDRLRPHREPEIRRIDLSGAVLDVMAWGGDPRSLEWFERPPEEAIAAGVRLLDRLGAIRGGKLTALGDEMRRLPVHPRLARMLITSGGARPIARACALLSERHFVPARSAATSADLLSAIDAWSSVPPHVQAVAQEIENLMEKGVVPLFGRDAPEKGVRPLFGEADFRKAVLAAYPDRIAQRRAPMSPRVRLASGAGAVLGRESGVVDGEFLVAVDVHRPAQPGFNVGRGVHAEADEARIRVASQVDRDWLLPTHSETVHEFDADTGRVRASTIDRYDALLLAKRPAEADPAIVAALLAQAWLDRGPRPADERLLRRLRFANVSVDITTLVRSAAELARSLGDIDLSRALSSDISRALERDAPERLRVPSGRTVAVDYGDDGSVSAAVKLQELFGLAESPRIGKARTPVLLALLAPNGRPVQLTRDLRSFWERTYPEVRKELRGRYPKHPWPVDPWTAPATSKTTAQPPTSKTSRKRG